MEWFSRKSKRPNVRLTTAPIGDDSYPIWTEELESHAQQIFHDGDNFRAHFRLNDRLITGWAIGGTHQGIPRLWRVRAFIVELTEGSYAASLHFSYEGENPDFPGGERKMFWRMSVVDRVKGVFKSVDEIKATLAAHVRRIDKAAEEAYEKVAEKFSPQKLLEAKHLMSEAKKGDADAQYKLGQIYQSGDGLPRDEQESLKWITSAAKQAHAEAEWLLGFTYEEGFGVERSSKEAARWYQRAAEHGHAGAQLYLANLYENGAIDGLQNFLMAIYWYEKADERGQPDAPFRLARLYENTQQDFGKALEWYRKAANKGDAAAEWHLGRAYYEGVGVPCDKEEGLKWYARALTKENFVLSRSSLTEAEKKLFGHLKDRIAEPDQFIAVDRASDS